MVARSAFGSHPTSMKSAVRRPHAIRAGMLGMIMFDKNVPNFWTLTRAPLGGAACVDVDI